MWPPGRRLFRLQKKFLEALGHPFFDGEESYTRFRDAPALSAEAVAKIYGVDPADVRRYPVDSLQVLKISYPRAAPPGGALERDMHGGQQYVRLLDVELEAVG